MDSDEKAFKKLFGYFYPGLLNYAFVIIKNHQIAEDIVLEVMQHFWERRHSIGNIENLTSYLYVSVKNKTLDQHKKNSRLIQVAFDKPHYEEIVTFRNPESTLLTEELAGVINQAIMKLPEKARLVFRLIKEEGMSYKEVAETLDISVKTVNNNMLRAMKAIRQEVTRYLRDEGLGQSMRVIRSLLILLTTI